MSYIALAQSGNMVFNSLAFLSFFVVFFVIYWWVARKGSLNALNLLLLIGSYIFYGWWDWRFLTLIFISSISDFLIGLKLNEAPKNKRKPWLILSLLINLGILGFFKYYNFFVDSFTQFIALTGLNLNTSTLNIILPVGISFYTFQTLSYTIDIYRGHVKPTTNMIQFMAFVSFFPQLVAGPIERASTFLPQFAIRKKFSYPKTIEGLRLMLWGFFKKIVIADNFALLADDIFASPESYSGFGVFLGSVLFAFQIYCDFSGYSDIAIGLGKTLGFELMTNFNKPYFSKSFTEFWKRWHISLSTWFRDYVYIPLGGKRVSNSRHNYNLMTTFLLSGLWHGANFTFLIWGFLHGAVLILEKRFKWTTPIAILPVFMLTCLFWLPFRAEDFSHFKTLIVRIFTAADGFTIPVELQESAARYSVLAIVFIGFIILEKLMKEGNFSELTDRLGKPLRLATYYMLLLCILLLGNFDVKPYFIYFQF